MDKKQQNTQALTLHKKLSTLLESSIVIGQGLTDEDYDVIMGLLEQVDTIYRLNPPNID